LGLFKIILNKPLSRSIIHLKPGETGIVSGFTDSDIGVKLMEMGCLPGVRVRVNFYAPLGDPVCISVAGYELSLRLAEASTVSILTE
jgi:ferrous iron transport protein A